MRLVPEPYAVVSHHTALPKRANVYSVTLTMEYLRSFNDPEKAKTCLVYALYLLELFYGNKPELSRRRSGIIEDEMDPMSSDHVSEDILVFFLENVCAFFLLSFKRRHKKRN